MCLIYTITLSIEAWKYNRKAIKAPSTAATIQFEIHLKGKLYQLKVLRVNGFKTHYQYCAISQDTDMFIQTGFSFSFFFLPKTSGKIYLLKSAFPHSCSSCRLSYSSIFHLRITCYSIYLLTWSASMAGISAKALSPKSIGFVTLVIRPSCSTRWCLCLLISHCFCLPVWLGTHPWHAVLLRIPFLMVNFFSWKPSC